MRFFQHYYLRGPPHAHDMDPLLRQRSHHHALA